MPLVKCSTLFNETRLVPSETLIQRPAVYGLVTHNQQLLVVKAHYTGRYVLPGGAIEKGEAVEAALKREVWEETSLDVEVGDFLHFTTDFFYYDPADLAIHGFLFFYRCRPLTTEFTTPHYEPDEGLDGPLWVSIDTLHADHFQSFGNLTMTLLAEMIC